MSHVIPRDSSSIKFERADIAFVLALFHWLEPLTDEGEGEGEVGGGGTGVPEENTDDKLQKMPHTKTQSLIVTRTRTLAFVAGAC